MNSRGFVAYELKGESLDAAIRLDLRVREYLSRVPAQQTGNLLDIHLSWGKRYKEALAEIRADDPQLLAACGLDSPALQVEAADQTYPRAYEAFPAVYWTSAKQAVYLMYSPVDYKGGHFVPKDAVPCAEKDFDSTDMGHLIYKKHFWVGEGPVVDGGKRGMNLPADYDPATAHTVNAAGLRPGKCFKVGGETLYAVEQFEQQKELFSHTFRAFANAVQEWAAKNMPGHNASIMMRTEQGRNVTEIAFRDNNNGNPAQFSHPDWIIDKQHERDWTNPVTGQVEHVILNQYDMRPNPDTEAGLALYMLFKMMPVSPQTQHIPELTIHAARGEHYPVIHRFPEGIFLAYHNFKDGENVTPPKDCVAVPPAVLSWLDRDRYDRQWGIQPPPRPAAINAALGKNNGPAAPRPPQP